MPFNKYLIQLSYEKLNPMKNVLFDLFSPKKSNIRDIQIMTARSVETIRRKAKEMKF